MTILLQVRVKRGVCGSSSWQWFSSSYYPFPSVYFDSKLEGVNPEWLMKAEMFLMLE
jgi:hypothetical protein